MNRNDLIRIYMKRAVLVLDEKELLALLKEHPDIWQVCEEARGCCEQGKPKREGRSQNE